MNTPAQETAEEVTAYVDAYATSDFGDGPGYARLTLNPQFFYHLHRLQTLCAGHGLTEARISSAPTAWDDGGDTQEALLLTLPELVVSGSFFYFHDHPRHADHAIETRGQDIAELHALYEEKLRTGDRAPIYLGADPAALQSRVEGSTTTTTTPATEPEADAVEHSTAFAAWFWNSKVTEESGEPLVVYHRTKKTFESFDKAAATLLHFGSAAQANIRALGGGLLVPVHLAISNPRRSQDSGSRWAAEIRSAREAGHDGIVYLNRYDGIPYEAFNRASQALVDRRGGTASFELLDALTDAEFKALIPEATDSYIAFDAAQIKLVASQLPDFAGPFAKFCKENAQLINRTALEIGEISDEAHQSLIDDMMGTLGSDAANDSSDNAADQEAALSKAESWVTDELSSSGISGDVAMSLWLNNGESDGVEWLRRHAVGAKPQAGDRNKP